MTDIILATGRQLSRELSTVPARIIPGQAAPATLTGAIAGSVAASGAAAKAPRQEWLGPASPRHSPADPGDAGESTSIRLVGHKVLAGAGRVSMPPSVDAASPVVTSIMTSAATSAGSAAYATRAIANFSQQLGESTAAKGTRVDTYA